MGVMERDWPADLLEAISGPFHAALLVRVDWPGGELRVHTGGGTIDLDDELWTGVGKYSWIQLPDEAEGLGISPGALRLGGLPEEVEEYLAVDPRGRAVEVLFATVTTAGGWVIDKGPGPLWSGIIGEVRDTQDPGGAYQIDVTIIARASQLSQGAAVFGPDDQQARSPGDTSGRWAAAQVTRTRSGVRTWIG